MYYPLYNNPFYYPSRAYMPNMCSYGYAPEYYKYNTNKMDRTPDTAETPVEGHDRSYDNTDHTNSMNNNDFFSFTGDRLEIFGISINIDDLIILIMLFFMFRETQIDYSIIIILALILFDQG